MCKFKYIFIISSPFPKFFQIFSLPYPPNTVISHKNTQQNNITKPHKTQKTKQNNQYLPIVTK